jgi:hypothetical protein
MTTSQLDWNDFDKIYTPYSKSILKSKSAILKNFTIPDTRNGTIFRRAKNLSRLSNLIKNVNFLDFFKKLGLFPKIFGIFQKIEISEELSNFFKIWPFLKKSKN